MSIEPINADLLEARLDKLSDGNLKHHTDFRTIYASILDQWLNVPSGVVLPEKFKGMNIFQ